MRQFRNTVRQASQTTGKSNSTILIDFIFEDRSDELNLHSKSPS